MGKYKSHAGTENLCENTTRHLTLSPLIPVPLFSHSRLKTRRPVYRKGKSKWKWNDERLGFCAWPPCWGAPIFIIRGDGHHVSWKCCWDRTPIHNRPPPFFFSFFFSLLSERWGLTFNCVSKCWMSPASSSMLTLLCLCMYIYISRSSFPARVWTWYTKGQLLWSKEHLCKKWIPTCR